MEIETPQDTPKEIQKPRLLMTSSEWIERYGKTGPPSDVDACIVKALASQVKAADEETRQLSMTISTGDRDRDRDILAVEGWNLENYKLNPVVLWAHESWSLPIGRTLELKTQQRPKRLTARAEFTDGDLNPFGFAVYRMLRAGFLNASSVGFRPLKWVYNEQENGYDFAEQELVEWSVVPVPSNPKALQAAKAAGIDTSPIKQWAEKYLDNEFGERGLWVPRRLVEESLKSVSGESVVVPASVAETFLNAVADVGESQGLEVAHVAVKAEPQAPPVVRVARSVQDDGMAVLTVGLKQADGTFQTLLCEPEVEGLRYSYEVELSGEGEPMATVEPGAVDVKLRVSVDPPSEAARALIRRLVADLKEGGVSAASLDALQLLGFSQESDGLTEKQPGPAPSKDTKNPDIDLSAISAPEKEPVFDLEGISINAAQVRELMRDVTAEAVRDAVQTAITSQTGRIF